MTDKIKKLEKEFRDSGVTSKDIERALKKGGTRKMLGDLHRFNISETVEKDNIKGNQKLTDKKMKLHEDDYESAELSRHQQAYKFDNGIKSKKLKKQLAQQRKLKSLYESMAELEINTAKQQDEIFRVVSSYDSDEDVDVEKSIQFSIGAHNQYDKKYRVLKKFKDVPSLELASNPFVR